ncbi:: DDE_Tnp_1_assoc [Gemmata massiliana]|uniref:: DDE_Tnp_1_assoc n=1 Tax=Gemmata massiliana TaxID=1210884 RepID=A0A6P2CZW5_9BACT|nr:: DDE_Tnp_1_assoc [Gemmata massiliana]
MGSGTRGTPGTPDTGASGARSRRSGRFVGRALLRDGWSQSGPARFAAPRFRPRGPVVGARLRRLGVPAPVLRARRRIRPQIEPSRRARRRSSGVGERGARRARQVALRAASPCGTCGVASGYLRVPARYTRTHQTARINYCTSQTGILLQDRSRSHLGVCGLGRWGRLPGGGAQCPRVPCTTNWRPVPDPRGLQGPIHPLPAVLGLVTLVVRMGRTSLRGIARFGRQHGHPLARALGFRRGQTPAASTRSRFGPSKWPGRYSPGMPCSVSGMSPRRGRGLCAGRQGQPTRVGDRHRSRVGVRGRCPRDQCGHFPLSRSPRPSNWAPGHDGRQGARRLEPRTLRTNPILTAHDRWKGLKQGFRMPRTRTGGGATTLEVVYGITSLSPAGRRASPSGMGSVLLAHREPTALRARCDPTRGCMPRAPGPLHRCSRPRATPGSTDSPPLPPNTPRSLSASPARITQRPCMLLEVGRLCYAPTSRGRRWFMPTGTSEYQTKVERQAVERAIAFVAQMHDLAPAGQVLDQCE